MVTNIVADVPSDKEGGLSEVDEELEGPLQPIGHDEHDKLDVSVKERDGPQMLQIVLGFARLGNQADHPLQQPRQGPRIACSCEGSVEHLEKDRGEGASVGNIELVGEAIAAGAGAAPAMGHGPLKLLSSEASIAVGALRLARLPGVEGSPQRRKELVLSRNAGSGVRGTIAEEASRGVRGEVRASIGERADDAAHRGEVGRVWRVFS
jgi:hypothetical protein